MREKGYTCTMRALVTYTEYDITVIDTARCRDDVCFVISVFEYQLGTL